MSENNYLVIMAGGIGSRFWPASRSDKPKQFLDILGTGKTLLQQTIERYRDICPVKNMYIVTNEKYDKIIMEQLPDFKDEQILKEPIGRNTAPAIAYAAFRIAMENPEATMIVAPSDHAILNEKLFKQAIDEAVSGSADGDKLITLGIKPHKPETGYGYIQFIESDEPIKKVKTFTEKPELQLAKAFVESGDFVWNSGMFIWKNSAIIEAIKSYLPDLHEVFKEASDSFLSEGEEAAIKIAYSQCHPISIDYGIMEKASNVYVIPAMFDWSDLGSWAALHEMSDKDKNNNVIDGNVMVFDVKNSMIKGPLDKLIVAEGLDGYLIAEHGNAILICKKDNERQFRKMFSKVKREKGDDYL